MTAKFTTTATPFAAGSTPSYTATIIDEDNDPVPSSVLSSVTLSIVDTASGSIINGVSAVNILNNDRGTVDQSGNLTVNLAASDTQIFNPANNLESRSLVITWVISGVGGGGTGKKQIDFSLQKMSGP